MSTAHIAQIRIFGGETATLSELHIRNATVPIVVDSQIAITIVILDFRLLVRFNPLGKHICWQAASQFGSLFSKVNFSSKKHDLGFALMNQLSTAQKRFPRNHQEIAAVPPITLPCAKSQLR